MADGNKAVDSDKVWTVLITNEAYLPGLITLAYSLRASSSAYPLVALYTDTLSPAGHAALDARSLPKQRIDYVLPAGGGRDYSNDPRFYDCWSKLAPFSLTQYTRVVQLDADMLVLRNMDELMTLPLDPPGEVDTEDGKRVFAAGHACVCNPLQKPHYPKDWIPANCAFTHQHDWVPGRAGKEAISPSVGPLGYMNGGLQVVNPCKAAWARILAHMDKEGVNMDFADQSLLSGLYRGRWVPLPYIYNALKTLRWKGVHDALWVDEDVKNVHYILAPKPWDEKPEEAKDETHAWWHKLNKERKEEERLMGIVDDGF